MKEDDALIAPALGRVRPIKGPTAEPFLYRWDVAELQKLRAVAGEQLLRTREAWSLTNSGEERARLNRRILGLADLVLKTEQLIREKEKCPGVEQKPPESPA